MDEGQKRRTGAILFIIGTVSFIQTGLYTIVWCIGVGIDFGLRFFPLAVELLQLFGYPIVGSLLLVVAVQILLEYLLDNMLLFWFTLGYTPVNNLCDHPPCFRVRAAGGRRMANLHYSSGGFNQNLGLYCSIFPFSYILSSRLFYSNALRCWSRFG
jgi:hypothetical protein